MPLSKDDVSAIETVAHYTHDEDQAYLMLYGEQLAGRRPSPGFAQLCGMSDGFACRTCGESQRASHNPGHPAATRATLIVRSRWPTGEGVFETIPIEADYTVGDMKLWLNFHKVRGIPRAAHKSTQHVQH
jgi:hypothetical protein